MNSGVSVSTCSELETQVNREECVTGYILWRRKPLFRLLAIAWEGDGREGRHGALERLGSCE